MIGIDNYVQVGSVKSAWVTLYILNIVLGVLYMLKPLFESSDDSDLDMGDKKSGGLLSRIGVAFNVIRDNAFMQLFALCLNGFGAASTKALSILSWIYFAITIICAVAVLFMDNRMIRAIFNLIFFVLILIMSSLAFKQGW